MTTSTGACCVRAQRDPEGLCPAGFAAALHTALCFLSRHGGWLLRIQLMKKTSLAVVVVVSLALAGGGGYWWWSQRSAAEAVQYRTAKLERGNLQATVSASVLASAPG